MGAPASHPIAGAAMGAPATTAAAERSLDLRRHGEVHAAVGTGFHANPAVRTSPLAAMARLADVGHGLRFAPG